MELPYANGKPVAPKRLAVADYLDDFSFSPDYRYLLGSSRQARGGEVIELDSGARVASIPLSGMPHLGSGIYWKRDGRWVFATPNISRGVISVIDLQNWKPLKEIVTDGPGFFMRSHADSPYAWTDTFLGKKHDEILLIDKQTLKSPIACAPARARSPATSSSPATAATPCSASGTATARWWSTTRTAWRK